MLNIMHTRFMYCSLLVVYILLLLASMCASTRTTMHTLLVVVCIILCILESRCMAAYGEFLGKWIKIVALYIISKLAHYRQAEMV